jgi:hypothetical protein
LKIRAILAGIPARFFAQFAIYKIGAHCAPHDVNRTGKNAKHTKATKSVSVRVLRVLAVSFRQELQAMNTIAIPTTNKRRILHHSATRRNSHAIFALRQDRAINSPGSQEFASNGEVFALFVGDQIARTPDASPTSNVTLPVQPAE